MSSKYPDELDVFETKHDAVSQDDPAGDYVMAEDINELQDAIVAIQTTMGTNPQGGSTTIGDRIAAIESVQSLNVPSVLMYLGDLDKINGMTSSDQISDQLIKFDHVTIGKNAQSPTSLGHALVKTIIEKTRAKGNTKFYGYIDCSLGSETLSETQTKISQWIDMGVQGIYCGNMGYDKGVTRTKQNDILDSIHQYNMSAILNVTNPDDIFSDIFHASFNPTRVAPNIESNDTYHFENFAVDASGYIGGGMTFTLVNKLLQYRNELGIKIFATATIPVTTGAAQAQVFFDYARAVALLSSLDGFYAVDTNYGIVSNQTLFFDNIALIGQWYTSNPAIVHSVGTDVYSRATSFGSILVDTNNHTYEYRGASVPSNMIRVITNTLNGTVLIDDSVPDSKLQYNGNRLITAINTGTDTIDIERIEGLVDESGGISEGYLQANVISAINASIGSATIAAAKIGNLSAEQITVGTLAAGRISGSVVTALNLYAANMEVGSAKMDSAVIGELTAEHITASVIEAINLSVTGAVIGEAKIGNLNADKISAGNIAADRMRANVVNAINIYAEGMVVGDAVIDTAAIGELKVDHMVANVIEAVNASIATATIDGARIRNLNADYITAGDINANRLKAQIVEAVNLYAATMNASSARINSGAIGVLSADHMQVAVLAAINASVESAVINKAKIGQLDANNLEANSVTSAKIVAGAIDADKIQANAITAGKIDVDAVTAREIAANTITASEIAAHTITANEILANTITAAQIAANTITASEIAADAITASELAADSVVAGKIAALAISAANIQADAIIAGKIAADAITTREIAVGAIEAENIKAGAVTADAIYAGSVTTDKIATGAVTANEIAAGTITATQLAADSIGTRELKADAVEAENVKAGAIVAGKLAVDSIVAGNIQTDAVTSTKIKANSIVSTHIAVASLEGDRIKVNSLDGDRIKARSIEADQIVAGSITAVEIGAGSITSTNIHADAITADKIKAGSIEAGHIATGGLDANFMNIFGQNGQVLIGGGYIRVDGLDVGVVQSDNLLVNGLFLTASSAFGLLRDNEPGAILLGSQSTAPGGHQVWRINLGTDEVTSINIPGKKPVDITLDQIERFAYVTVQGDNTMIQIDLAHNQVTEDKLPTNVGPAKISYTGAHLFDRKHMFVLATDPDDVNIPDVLHVIDAPPTSINSSLYMHHTIPLGNKPWDLVLDERHHTYVTMADDGDILELDMSNVDSMQWKVVGRIPIAAYATDNYHGGLPAEFGLNVAVGGSASVSYDLGASDAHAGHSAMHSHGGYGASTGVMKTYEPRGLVMSSDVKTIFVVDHTNNQLVVVDKYGNAFYNAMSGTREKGNLGEWGTPNPTLIPSQGGDTEASGDGGHVHSMSVEAKGIKCCSAPEEEVVFRVEELPLPEAPIPPFLIDPTPQDSYVRDYTNTRGETKYVRYRIDLGDGPEFVKLHNGKLFITLSGSGQVAIIDEAPIITAITEDRAYYFNEFTNFPALRDFTVRYVNVGVKPMEMKVDETNGLLYVAVSGQNQVVVIDTETEEIVRTINTGANPRGLALNSDGTELYVVNHGGTGSLSFVYPTGSYIGDAYIGLEGQINHHGAYGWMPNRLDWVQNPDGSIRSSSTIEFRINEPFLNEGGYVKLSAQGVDLQRNSIEQDIVNVINYSDGTSPQGTHFKWHNASAQISIAPGSSPNFRTWMEVDEFVPKFVAVDNQQTSSWTPIEDGIDEEYTGLYYSGMTNRAMGKTVTSSVAPTTGSLTSIVDAKEPANTEEENGEMHHHSVETSEPVFSIMHTFGETVVFPSGLQYVTVDMGQSYMIGKVVVMHDFHAKSIFHNTKTQISEDGIAWTTIYDSAVDGEYPEYVEHTMGTEVHREYGKHIEFDARPVRYIRDYANGYSLYDADWANPVSYTENHWTEIKAYGDWEVVYGEEYPDNTDKAGQSIATNGNCYVTTDIPNAYVAIDIAIEFTSWSWMTYIGGPQYGIMGVEMTTLMNSAHFVDMSWSYKTNLSHRHTMTFPPSVNVKEDTAKGIKAGKHRLVLRQVSGRITLDRMRFDDFQQKFRSSSPISSATNKGFNREKIIAGLAMTYEGVGRQATEGAYDEPRLSPFTHLPDYSVPLKYRVRIKTELDPSGSVEERGITYVTSCIMETGKLSSHWRMSQSGDLFAGTRIEPWDPSQPHKTGIQSFHLANGSVRGNKIMPNTIMNHHISPYARIPEFKLDLNYPTHMHGRTLPSPGFGVPGEFVSNKAVLDSIEGWAHCECEDCECLEGGTCTCGDGCHCSSYGTENIMARKDHHHNHLYLAKDATGGFTGDFVITGNLTVTGNIGGTDIGALQAALDTHIADTNAHLSSADRIKFTGIATGATLTELSATNGNIKINGVETVVYTHPTTAGNKHIPTGGATGNTLKWSASGTAVWGSVAWTELTGVPSTFTPAAHNQTVSTISDIGTYYAALASANTFTNTMTITKEGLGLKVQPVTKLKADASPIVLVQVTDSAGADLFKVSSNGDILVTGNLNVSGTTTTIGTTTVAGDYTIQGNLAVDGSTTLGSGDATDIIRVKGEMRQINTLVEIMTIPVFGPGDLPIEANDTTFVDIIDDYGTFLTGSDRIPAKPASAERWFKLKVRYNDEAGSTTTLRIVQQGTSTSAVTLTSGTDFDMPNLGKGKGAGARTWVSAPFQSTHTGDTTFQFKRNTAGSYVQIKYIEVMVYDKYTS